MTLKVRHPERERQALWARWAGSISRSYRAGSYAATLFLPARLA